MPFDLYHDSHVSLTHEVVHTLPHVVQIGGIGGNDVDHTGDLLMRTVRRMRMVMSVAAMPIRRRTGIVHLKARCCIANNAAELAQFLQRVFHSVFHVVRDDKEQFLPG